MSIGSMVIERAKRNALWRLGDLRHPHTGQKIEIDFSYSLNEAKVCVDGNVPDEIIKKITDVFGEELRKEVQKKFEKSLEKSLGKGFHKR